MANSFTNEGLWDLTPQQEGFLAWLTGERPIRPDGKPESEAQYAERIGVVPSTLFRWKQNTAFRRAWDKKMRDSYASPEKIGTLLQKQYDKAADGDTKAFEAYLKAIGQMAPDRLQIESKVGSAQDMSDEEIEVALQEAARRMSKQAADVSLD